ncbi:MAG: glycosyltransferase family 4 protein [Gemmatimonadaceae bacterium]
MNGARVVRVFFPCTGLGRQRRGFETFTRECAAALRDDPRLAITVFGGGGPFAAEGERFVPNFPRDSRAAQLFGALTRKDPYFVEQATFFSGFLPRLVIGRPDVVYFADLNFGNACWHWRRISGQRFRLLFYNGGATTQPFTRCDLVQQVSPEHFDSAIARGEVLARQVLLPHGVTVPPVLTPPSADDRARILATLGLPVDRPILLSVGMLDSSVKRMDYLIREVASLGEARPFLLVAGATSAETPGILALAREVLGENGFSHRMFAPAEMALAHRAADAYALASLREGFGLATVEALGAGLSCVLHDTPTTEYIAGPHALRADLHERGAMAPLIRRALASGGDVAAMQARHRWVLDKFSWDALRGRYAEMLCACAGVRTA